MLYTTHNETYPIFTLAITIILTVLPWQPAQAGAQDFTIPLFTADYYLSRDAQHISHLRVQERIIAKFPLEDQNHDTSLKITSVTDIDGHALNYDKSTKNTISYSRSVMQAAMSTTDRPTSSTTPWTTSPPKPTATMGSSGISTATNGDDPSMMSKPPSTCKAISQYSTSPAMIAVLRVAAVAPTPTAPLKLQMKTTKLAYLHEPHTGRSTQTKPSPPKPVSRPVLSLPTTCR